jgi:tRNA-splicing ligase RtcB (3'-phosphate/5'-hydroxy nucleic acid ligase)
MNVKAFSDLVNGAGVRGQQRDQVWTQYKSGDIDGAVAAVQQIKALYEQQSALIELRDQPIPYQVWGRDQIEQGAFQQMHNAARLPIALGGALMPDAHPGYGLPIGGVLATDAAVIPYAVGVDIACRMMLTVYPIAASALDDSAEFARIRTAVLDNTVFGAGADGLTDGHIDHPILHDPRWQNTTLLRGLHKTARHQLGTSGTGNHFVDVGVLRVTETDAALGLATGEYLAVLSHSGSRGVGYKIAENYSQLAMQQMPRLDDSVKHLAWLPLDTSEGAEYWEAMHLAGDFASANHHVIHERIAAALGVRALAAVENHHNFAWRETVQTPDGPREAIVHRKGATPAGAGVLGVIPGTMGDVGYVVRGKGLPASLSSASHGSGRQMSRTAAKKSITADDMKAYLKANKITLIGGGLDEAPQAYKRIEQVLAAQQDLVEVLATFTPRLVRMANGDNDPRGKSKGKRGQGGKPMPKDVFDAPSD